MIYNNDPFSVVVNLFHFLRASLVADMFDLLLMSLSKFKLINLGVSINGGTPKMDGLVYKGKSH